MLFRSWTLFLLLLVHLTSAQEDGCPDEQRLLPCTCDAVGINCMRAKSTSDIQAAFRATGQNEHHGLWIQKTPVRSIINGAFGQFKFAEVYVELNRNLSTFVLDALGESRNTLKTLSLYGNALNTFAFEKLSEYPGLTVFNLAANVLRTIPPRAFRHENLETVALVDNPIASIGRNAFYELRNLKRLLLQNTRLRTLGPYSFAWTRNNPHLEIQLQGSRISSISETAFNGVAPKTLNLAMNRLSSLPEDVFVPLMNNMIRNSRANGGFLSQIYTRGNPFTCQGCDYDWLVRHKDHAGLRVILRDFHCDDRTPLALLTHSLIQCQPDDDGEQWS